MELIPSYPFDPTWNCHLFSAWIVVLWPCIADASITSTFHQIQSSVRLSYQDSSQWKRKEVRLHGYWLHAHILRTSFVAWLTFHRRVATRDKIVKWNMATLFPVLSAGQLFLSVCRAVRWLGQGQKGSRLGDNQLEKQRDSSQDSTQTTLTTITLERKESHALFKLADYLLVQLDPKLLPFLYPKLVD